MTPAAGKDNSTSVCLHPGDRTVWWGSYSGRTQFFFWPQRKGCPLAVVTKEGHADSKCCTVCEPLSCVELWNFRVEELVGLQEVSVNPWHSCDPRNFPWNALGHHWRILEVNGYTEGSEILEQLGRAELLKAWLRRGLGIGRCWGRLNLWRFRGYLGNLSQPEWRLEITDAKERLVSIYS